MIRKINIYILCLFLMLNLFTDNVLALRPQPDQLSANEMYYETAADEYLKDIIKRYNRLYGSDILSENKDEFSVLEGIAGAFGIREGNSQKRRKIAKKIIFQIYNSAMKEHYLSRLMPNLLKHSVTQSGTHRFAPLALAVINLFRGNNIFNNSEAGVLAAVNDKFLYLQKDYLLYANPNNVPAEKIPDYTPFLMLKPVADKQRYKWLDIGSGPKTGGAPNLETLKEAFSLSLDQNIDITGVDLFFPVFTFNKDGSIEENNSYVFDENGRCVLRGINYLNANFPQNNVLSDDFNIGKYDFISMCKVLQDLKSDDEELTQQSIADVHFSKDSSDPRLWIYPTQRKVITRLLNMLTINGILFIDTHPNTGLDGVSDSEWRKTSSNIDLFLIIQRTGEDEFTLYDLAIPFRPNATVFSSREVLLKSSSRPYWKTYGLAAKFPACAEDIGVLLDQADMLAYRFQKKDYSVWKRLIEALDILNSGGSLVDVFKAYLKDVPIYYKRGIMNDVTSISQAHQKSEDLQTIRMQISNSA